MAEDNDGKEIPFHQTVRDAFKGNKTPASLELVANVYADISNIRDLAMDLIPFLLETCKTSEEADKLRDFTRSVYNFQGNIGSGLDLLIAEARSQKNEG